MSCGGAQNNNKRDITVASEDHKNQFVLIELFTSQGCSSCPPADALFAEYVKKQHNLGYVFALSFHVDYWDRLGWKDPFSNVLFTERQVSYQKVFSNTNIYTPQMVVNGKYELVGSDRTKLDKVIGEALRASYDIVFTKLKVEFENDIASGDYEVMIPSDSDEVSIFLVSLSETTVVKKGENRGKTLSSLNVVRQMLTHLKASKGHFTFEKMKAGDKNNLAVVAIVSDKKTMAIKVVKMKKFVYQ